MCNFFDKRNLFSRYFFKKKNLKKVIILAEYMRGVLSYTGIVDVQGGQGSPIYQKILSKADISAFMKLSTKLSISMLNLEIIYNIIIIGKWWISSVVHVRFGGCHTIILDDILREKNLKADIPSFWFFSLRSKTHHGS